MYVEHGFALSLEHGGVRGCFGVAGKCSSAPHFDMWIADCPQCEHPTRVCWFTHQEATATHVQVCVLCARRTVLMDRFLAVGNLDMTTQPPEQTGP